MKRLPTMKQLQYLVALADTRHFARAAERCHITQSTLSAGIRDLESVLGTAVAERSNRQVLMTGVGGEIAERAKALLRDAEEVMEVARAGRDPMTGELRLGVIPTIGPFYLPRVLPALRERFRDLTVYLREEQTAPLLGRLEDGELDAVVIALPCDTRDLVAESIFEDAFLFACHPAHPLAGAAAVRPEALAGERLLLLEEGHWSARPCTRCLQDGGHAGAGAVRGEQPAYPGTHGWGRHRRHAGTAARGGSRHPAGYGRLAVGACGAGVPADRAGVAADIAESPRVPAAGGGVARTRRNGVMIRHGRSGVDSIVRGPRGHSSPGFGMR